MVLSRAVAMVDSAGQTVPISDKLREELNIIITEMASRGLRTLGLSYTGTVGRLAISTGIMLVRAADVHPLLALEGLWYSCMRP